MKAIAVIDRGLALGNKGKLLFHLPGDLAHFKRETIGRTIIMGRKTLESMPGGKPLPGRTTLVLSRSAEGAFKSPEELIAAAPDDAIVCGGAEIYKLFMDRCNELILTEVDTYAKEADAFFPSFREDFKLKSSEGPFCDGEYTYSINRYERICEGCKDFKGVEECEGCKTCKA